MISSSDILVLITSVLGFLLRLVEGFLLVI